MQDLGCACNAPWGITLPVDMTRQEANHANNEWLRVQRQRRRAWSAAQAAVRARGEEYPFEPESLRGGNEENEDEE
jgi:hypothetical protein